MTNVVSLDSHRKLEPVELIRADIELSEMFVEGFQDVMSYIRTYAPKDDTEAACEACLLLINYFQSE